MKYIELVKGLFTAAHETRAKQADPYVAYSVEANKLMFNLIHEETQINYFYIESLEDNNVITLDSTTWAGYGNNKSKLEYSNDTTSWTSMNGVDSITVNNGEKLYMRCIDSNICKDFNSITDSITEEELEIFMYTPLFKTSANCNIGGNINTVMFDYTYKTEDCVLPVGAFGGLFFGIDIMTEAPANYIIDTSKLVLPATSLSDMCYGAMFAYCASLVTTPELPATELADECYNSMFMYCTSLTTAPKKLPATTLAAFCYISMFDGCTSLTIAPELPATTLAAYCYNSMFLDCTSLNCIKCLATNISASYCTYAWVNGVASTGTFIKNPDMSDWTTGSSGIPEDWIVEDAVL